MQDATIALYWLHSLSRTDVRQVDLIKLNSDEHGMVTGVYDPNSVPANTSIWIHVGKDGYYGYHDTRRLPEYVLKREFGPADLTNIIGLPQNAKVRGLREILAGHFTSTNLYELVFFHEQELRPALRELLREEKVRPMAIQLLAFIGAPEDVRLAVERAPPPSSTYFENRWAYAVVSALLNPTSREEWEFLRSAALNHYDDLWVDAGAILALKLIGSSRSVAILREVETKNQDRQRLAAQAIRHIESAVGALADRDLVRAGEKVAQAVRIGRWMRNGEPQFNQSRTMALINFEFLAGRDLLIYTGTFHDIDGVWRLRGVRHTMQALLPVESHANPRSPAN